MKMFRTWREGNVQMTGWISSEKYDRLMNKTQNTAHREVYVPPLDHTELPHVAMRQRNADERELAPYRPWRYYAALWIAVDALVALVVIWRALGGKF